MPEGGSLNAHHQRLTICIRTIERLPFLNDPLLDRFARRRT